MAALITITAKKKQLEKEKDQGNGIHLVMKTQASEECCTYSRREESPVYNTLGKESIGITEGLDIKVHLHKGERRSAIPISEEREREKKKPFITY